MSKSKQNINFHYEPSPVFQDFLDNFDKPTPTEPAPAENNFSTLAADRLIDPAVPATDDDRVVLLIEPPLLSTQALVAPGVPAVGLPHHPLPVAPTAAPLPVADVDRSSETVLILGDQAVLKESNDLVHRTVKMGNYIPEGLIEDVLPESTALQAPKVLSEDFLVADSANDLPTGRVSADVGRPSAKPIIAARSEDSLTELTDFLRGLSSSPVIRGRIRPGEVPLRVSQDIGELLQTLPDYFEAQGENFRLDDLADHLFREFIREHFAELRLMHNRVFTARQRD